MITVIENIHPMSAEELFDVLKKEFADYINSKLDSEINIDFTHVHHEVNVLFRDVTRAVLTISVSEQEIVISDDGMNIEENVNLLEKYLIEFVRMKAG